MHDKLRDSTAIQRDLSLEIWADRNTMKFRVTTSWEGVTPHHSTGAGGSLPREQICILVEGSLADNLSTSQQRVLMAKAADHLLGCTVEQVCGQQMEGSVNSSLFHTRKTVPEVMFSFGLPSTRQTMTDWNEPSGEPPRWLKGWGTWCTWRG